MKHQLNEMRRVIDAEPAAPHARITRDLGPYSVTLQRAGSTRRVTVTSLGGVTPPQMVEIAAALGAPAVDQWRFSYDGITASCEWVE